METLNEEQLRAQFPISPEAELAVLQTGHDVDEALNSPRERTIGIIGPCAMTNHPVELIQEGRQIVAIGGDGLVAVQRMPVWKPRSNPEKDWQGLETGLVEIRDGKGYTIESTKVEGAKAAYSILGAAAEQYGGAAIEVAHDEHFKRYDRFVPVIWSGSRAIDNIEHQLMIATRDPKTPFLVKNGMDGSIDKALAVVDRINQVRNGWVENPATTAVVFRGGENLRTPESWEKAYIDALDATNGKLIVDVAHGSEIAHDPNGQFGKSVKGQIAAMQSVIRLAREGHVPAGIMIEASNLESPTDPVMPLSIALRGVKALHKAKTRQLTKV